MECFDSLQLAMFSGKGGVGKTTVSCGTARQWARRFPDERILLISTDPAHSLADVLRFEVTDIPASVPDLPNLSVRALDADRLLADFKTQYGEVLELLVERGSFVDGEDLSPVWDLEWPGLDELMGILEIQRILREGVADRVVVDMAPSGHTLNLFGLMDFLDNFLAALDLFQEKHRYMLKALSGKYSSDEADRFIRTMQADLKTGRNLLQDVARTACWIVAIPEPMSWLESRRFIQSLAELKIPIGGIFVNRVLAGESARALAQRLMLHQFDTLVPERPVFRLPQQIQEPVEGKALDRLMAQIKPIGEGDQDAIAPLDIPVQWPVPMPPHLEDLLTAGRRLVLVGGKGGVGKTTVAAAIAWHSAAHHQDAAVRVISIDPAHSLGDALGEALGHDPRQLTNNLSAQEVDAHQVLDDFREDYLWELAEMMSGSDDIGGGLQVAYGPEAWRQIVAQALPGIDEMLSLITVMDLLERDEQQLIVLDTAPTGHLLRFLEMPTALSDWLAWIFKLWIKYQDVVGRVELMGRLRKLRQRVVAAQKKLQDPQYTEFIGVVQNQSAILAEAQRLTQTLAEMGVSQRYIVHNRYEAGQALPAKSFAHQKVVCLPQLPCNVSPLAQIQGAGSLLFG
ncbi:MAG: ArsA family ATPase [Cyanobacteria bacterium P01_A01_bin.123]